MTRNYNAIGLMSGTSMDGIDVAVLESDGEAIADFGPALTLPYTNTERTLITDAINAARMLSQAHQRNDTLLKAEVMITQKHGQAVNKLLNKYQIPIQDIDLIGFHGQTVLHAPEKQLTIQIGDSAELARMIGVPVISDFRSADIKAGGQGAPLAPIYHKALLNTVGAPLPAAFINIGGVANITFLDVDTNLIAFDSGPGNAFINDLIKNRTGESYDHDGQYAQRGTINEQCLRQLLNHDYFNKPPPKSLDRNSFDTSLIHGLNLPDAAATLTAFTVHSIILGLKKCPAVPDQIIISGGGAHNNYMMAELKKHWTDSQISSANDVNLRIDDIESEAFAYLAIRSSLGLPLSFPGTTGIRYPLSGGIRFDP